ncbi:hypothetical protein Q5762_00755 [Streptomyces sp. P9(2023)]|nr:hypothetical protein [Streptomyces sp. P9(2023)]MDT9686905.1 hypothetical protein [Streptomyces sp. P9(2023)]
MGGRVPVRKRSAKDAVAKIGPEAKLLGPEGAAGADRDVPAPSPPGPS